MAKRGLAWSQSGLCLSVLAISLVICGNPSSGRRMALIPLLDLDALFFLMACHVQPQNEDLQRVFSVCFVLLGSPLSATCSFLKRKQNERESVGEEERRGGVVIGRSAGRRKVALLYYIRI